MNLSGSTALTFEGIDDLAFAAERGRSLSNALNNIKFSVDELGPLLELNQLVDQRIIPPPSGGTWLTLNGMTSFYRAILTGHRQWLCNRTRSIGFLRMETAVPNDCATWIAFGLAAQKAATKAGFSNRVAAQLVGALGEMHSNIYEHSELSKSGLLAFRAGSRMFEFVAADQGIGILDSLRRGPHHSDLKDHGTALRLALTDGCSRFGDGIGRGMGFRPLFVGLANLRGSLRFRSGDHALSMDGRNPSLIMARLAQKPFVRGFFAAVRCSASN